MVQFVIGVGYPADLFVQSVWRDAFSLCDTILSRPASRGNFLHNANEDFVATAYDIGIHNTYTVELTTNVDDLNSYVSIVPNAEHTVNFNPVLVLNIYKEFAPRHTSPKGTGSSKEAREELLQDASDDSNPAKASVEKRKAESGVSALATKAPKVEAQDSALIPDYDTDARGRQAVLFLAVKLAHEVWDLVHRQGSKEASRTNAFFERYREDKVEGKTFIVPYTDFGTLMERDLLGGVWDLTSRNRKHFMSLDAVAIYPSARSTLGAYLDPANTVISSENIDVRTLGPYRSRTVPKVSTSQRPITGDAGEGEEDEEEENTGRQPGTGGRNKDGNALSKW